MAAPSGMSVLLRGTTFVCRPHILLPLRPAAPGLFQPRALSWPLARLFSASSTLSAYGDIPPPPKVDRSTVTTPKYTPPSKKRKPKPASQPQQPAQAATNVSPQSLKRARMNNSTPLQQLLGTSTGTVASRMTQAYSNKLAAKGVETPLYEAPSHLWYTFGSIVTALFCFSYAFYNAWAHLMHMPAGIAPWVPYAYLVICMTMAGMGTFFFLAPARIVAYMKAVPATDALLRKARTDAARKSSLLVEVGIRRSMFGMGPKKVYVAPSDIHMKTALSAPLMTMSKGQLVKMEKKIQAERKAQREFDMDHLLTIPFRHMFRAFKYFFQAVRRIMSREGFAEISVAGRNYKLDILGGWALEGGKAVDRLLAGSREE